MNEIVSGSNYGELTSLTPRQQAQLTQLTAAIKKDLELVYGHLKRSVKHALQAGKGLTQAKEIAGRGHWLTYFRLSDYDISESTANRYMRVYKSWAELSKKVGEDGKKLPLDEMTLNDILRALAKPRKTNDDASGGGKINVETSTEAVEEHQLTGESLGDEDSLLAVPKSASIALLDIPSDEWSTPGHVVQAVVDVLGVIDLDPASGGQHVPAETHYTREVDGLDERHAWMGKVFLNPPLSPELVNRFVERITIAFSQKHVKEAIVLVPAATDAAWFRKLGSFVRAFLARPEFGTVPGMPDPLVAIYLGERQHVFFETFRELGDLFMPYRAA